MKKVSILIAFLLITFLGFTQPKLSSYPSAKATVFLDFDGHYVTGTLWNNGNPFYCQPSGLSDAQITEIFNRVAEDFRPFDINITTDSTVYWAAPNTKRVRVVVTPALSWAPAAGGISFTGSFTWGDNTPLFVFPDKLSWKTKSIAECCTHETGHTLGLSHQAKYSDNCSLVNVYNDGVGSGQIGWAPVMGNSYGKNLTSWNNGPTPDGCSDEQDNLSIITSGANGFTFRKDDHGNQPELATVLTLSKNTFSSSGVIETNNDADYFAVFLPSVGRLVLNAIPFSVGPDFAGANLDIQMDILNENKEVIGSYNPAETLDANADLTMDPGKYYIKIRGVGNQYTSGYGSLGSYSLAGNFTPYSTNPVTGIDLKGKSANGSHLLSWTLICDETIASQEIQVSYDGVSFNKLALVGGNARAFSYNPMRSGNMMYRLKITTASDRISYSNAISIVENSSVQIALKSNLVTDRVEINSSEGFHYLLMDMSGKILKKGNGTSGSNVINISETPHGIYVIQMNGNSQRKTERIVKL